MPNTARKELQAFREQLKDDFSRQVPIELLVERITRYTDKILLRAWTAALLDSNDFCLIAVGGYGRQELQPYSDIDILILYRDSLNPSEREHIEVFIQALWDIGLEVSQSVRSLSDCVAAAQSDLTIISNLLEARLLTGNTELFYEFLHAHSAEQIWPSKEFFIAKSNEQRLRYEKYDGTSYNLEPDVKSGPGGLRDIHTIGWVAKRHFNATNLHDLVTHGFLTEDDYRQLMAGQAFLWRVSFALHFYYNKRESRLLFESMADIAWLFEFHIQDKNQRIEQFMRQYFRTIKLLRQLNDYLLQYLRETVLDLDDKTVKIINDQFQTRNQYIEFRQEDLLSKNPSALLEIFLVMAQHPSIRGVRATTIRLLQKHAYLIDEDFRNNPYHRELFIMLLRQSSNIYEQFQRLNRYGLLARYMPVFSDIVGQMQYDLFHVYTVDQHILFLLRNIVRFNLEESRTQFPLCHQVMQNINKPELLYIAALFHDVAKGRGGDHSSLGAMDAEQFCAQHNLIAEDTALVVWLVEKHLIFSQTAQRKDIFDPDTISQFSLEVIDQTHLDYLYLLTVADICATNPNLWNSWRDSLLKELYEATTRVLSSQHSPLSHDSILVTKQNEARETLLNQHIHNEKIVALWRTFPTHYFLRESLQNLITHTKAILLHNDHYPVVHIQSHHTNSSTEVFIYTPLTEDVFAKSTIIFANQNFNIVEAKMTATADGFCLASYIILDEHAQKIRESDRLIELQANLTYYHQEMIKTPRLKQKRDNRQLGYVHLPTSVQLTEDTAHNRTVVQVICQDQPGLLARIAKTLHDQEVHLQNAKIATLGNRVEDVFYINDKQHQALRDPALLEQLQFAILQCINQQ